MGSDSYKFAVVILVALILLFCIWYFTSSRNNMMYMKQQENYQNENEDDEVEHMTNQVLNSQSGNTQVQADMPTPSEQELYRMAHAQDFPPETQTVQSNDPPLVGAGLQAEKSKNPAMQQLRQAGCFPKEMLTPAVFDRIRVMCTPVLFDGKSKRI